MGKEKNQGKRGGAVEAENFFVVIVDAELVCP